MRVFISILIIALLGVGGYFFINGSASFSPEKYKRQVEDVTKIEKANPAKFLTIEANAKRTLLGVGTKFKITGTISNKATATNYNDIELLLQFIDKNGSIISSMDYTLHESVKANATTSFDFKIEKPVDAEDVKCSINNAKAE